MPSCEPLAVTGLACRLPGAPDAEAFWRNVREARVAPTRSLEERWGIPRRRYIGRAGDADRTYTDLAFCLDTDGGPEDRQVELGRRVVDAALADAARAGRPLDLSRTALVAATSWTHPTCNSGRSRRGWVARVWPSTPRARRRCTRSTSPPGWSRQGRPTRWSSSD